MYVTPDYFAARCIERDLDVAAKESSESRTKAEKKVKAARAKAAMNSDSH